MGVGRLITPLRVGIQYYRLHVRVKDTKIKPIGFLTVCLSGIFLKTCVYSILVITEGAQDPITCTLGLAATTGMTR